MCTLYPYARCCPLPPPCTMGAIGAGVRLMRKDGTMTNCKDLVGMYATAGPCERPAVEAGRCEYHADKRRAWAMDRRSGNGAEWDAMDDAMDDALAEAQADAAELTGGPREYLMLPLESKDAAAPYWYGGWSCEGTAPDVRRAFPGVEDGEPSYLYFSRPLGFATGMGFGATQQRARLASGLIFAVDVSALLQGREGTLLERVRDARAELHEA